MRTLCLTDPLIETQLSLNWVSLGSIESKLILNWVSITANEAQWGHILSDWPFNWDSVQPDHSSLLPWVSTRLHWICGVSSCELSKSASSTEALAPASSCRLSRWGFHFASGFVILFVWPQQSPVWIGSYSSQEAECAVMLGHTSNVDCNGVALNQSFHPSPLPTSKTTIPITLTHNPFERDTLQSLAVSQTLTAPNFSACWWVGIGPLTSGGVPGGVRLGRQ